MENQKKTKVITSTQMKNKPINYMIVVTKKVKVDYDNNCDVIHINEYVVKEIIKKFANANIYKVEKNLKKNKQRNIKSSSYIIKEVQRNPVYFSERKLDVSQRSISKNSFKSIIY